jgi:photosystem II stability/assembly factor-like uncharacterized protein
MRLRRLVTISAVGVLLLALAFQVPAQQQPTTAKLPPVLKGLVARNIGPANMGGRVPDITGVDTDPNTIYVATAAGGVFKTSDGGTTWKAIFDNQATLCIGAVAVAPSNPNVVYVGTGEANPRNSVSWGNGVYRSTNGGDTWEHCGLTDTQHIGRVVVHPKNPDVAYVAALGHTWGPNKERGIYKTIDGGKSWTQSKFIDENTGFIDIAIDPSEPDVLYGATYVVRRDAFAGGSPRTQWGSTGGLFKTDDGGKTWNKMTNGLPNRPYGRSGLSVYRKDPRIVYAIVQTDSTADPNGNNGQRAKANEGNVETGGIFRSDDKGKTWKKVNDLVPRPFYYGQIRVDPNHDNWVYVLGVQSSASIDGGKTFERYANGTHSDAHALWIDPVDSKRQIFGCDGGLYISRDTGETFTAIRGMPFGQFYGVAVDMQKPYRVYGGLQDNGSWGGPSATDRTDGITLNDWRSIGGGDGFQAAVDPTDPNTVYVESQNGNIQRVNPTRGRRGGGGPDDDDGLRPVAQQEQQKGRGGQGKAKAGGGGNQPGAAPVPTLGLTGDDAGEDGGAKVTAVTAGGPAATAGLRINDIITKVGDKEIKNNPDLLAAIAAGRPGQAVKVEVLRGGAPQVIDATFGQAAAGGGGRRGGGGSIRPPGQRFNWNTPILLSSHDPKTLYVGATVVFKSTNRGDQWKAVSPDLTRRANTGGGGGRGGGAGNTVTTIAESPLQAGLLYAGTDDGKLFVGTDDNKLWMDLSEQIPGVPQDRWITRIEPSHFDKGTAYLTLNRYRVDDYKPYVFKTTNYGLTWTPLMNNLPNHTSTHVIRESSKNKNLLFLGTERGLYVSLNAGQEWHRLGNGMPEAVIVHDLVIHPRDRELVIGTHSRSVYVMDIAPLEQLTDQVLAANSHLFEVKPAVAFKPRQVEVRANNPSYIAPNPPYGAVIHYLLKNPVADATVTVADGQGNVLATLGGAKEAGLQYVVWNLRRDGSPDLVTPGEYTVTFKAGGAEQRTTVQVEADPRAAPAGGGD